MRQPNVDSSRLAVEPQPWTAIHAGVRILLVSGPELVLCAQVVQKPIAVQWHHRIAKVSQRDWSFAFDPPHGFPRGWQELMRHSAIVEAVIRPRRNKLARRS